MEDISSSIPTKVETTESDATETTTEAKAEIPLFKIGDTVDANDWNITVSAFEFANEIRTSEYTGFTPEDGSVYLIVSLTVKNVGSKAESFLPSFSLENSGIKMTYDGKYEFISSTMIWI